MSDIHKISAVYLLAVNIAAFAVYGWDKMCAKRGMWRVPEKRLLLLAFLGGSVGAMVGMAIFQDAALEIPVWRAADFDFAAYRIDLSAFVTKE